MSEPQTTLVQTTDSAPPAHIESDEPIYRRLTYSQLRLARDLKAQGKTQAQIAEVIGVNQSTVCRALKAFPDDTSDLAKDYAKSSAFRVMRRVVKTATSGKPDDATKAAKVVLAASGVVSTDNSGAKVAVQVVIGMPGQPAGRDPFAAE